MTWFISATEDPKFPSYPFTAGNSIGCNIQSISIHTNDVTGAAPATMRTTNIAGDPSAATAISGGKENANHWFKSSAKTTKNTYKFWIKVTHDGGFKWASLSSNVEFQLIVACGPLSTVVSEGAFPSPFTKIQYIRQSKGEHFTLPAFLSSEPSCPLEFFFSSASNADINVITSV